MLFIWIVLNRLVSTTSNSPIFSFDCPFQYQLNILIDLYNNFRNLRLEETGIRQPIMRKTGTTIAGEFNLSV